MVLTRQVSAMNLTKRSIEALALPAGGYTIHWDDKTSGLGIRVTAAGAKSFIYQRRIKGRTRRITLDTFPRMSVEGARRQAAKLAGVIADNRDPVAERRTEEAQQITLRQALDAYLESRDLKPGTVADIGHAMKGLRDWLSRPVVSLTPAMIETRHRKLGAKSEARANLTMRYLRAILNFAAQKWADDNGHPLIPYNPVKRLSATKGWYRVERRRNIIKEHELAPWWQAVEALGADPAMRHGPEYRDYYLTLLLTGLRRSEALNLTWEQVDFKARTLTVTDTKNREPHTLPLSAYLLALLQARTERSGSQYVFSAPDGQQIANFRDITRYIEQRSGQHITLHDLRRTFATVAERLDIPAYALKRLLNHKQTGDVTSGYLVIDVERLREPMEKITDFLLKAAGVRSIPAPLPYPAKRAQ